MAAAREWAMRGWVTVPSRRIVAIAVTTLMSGHQPSFCTMGLVSGSGEGAKAAKGMGLE
jgi:hypothetical protein